MMRFRLGVLAFLAVAGICCLAGCGSSESESTGQAAAVRSAPAPADPAADRTGPLFPHFQSGRWGFIDAQGRVAISAMFDMVAMFRGPVAPARQGGLWGLIDRDGQWVAAPAYVQLVDIGEDMFGFIRPTEGGQEAGFLTREGKTIWSAVNSHAGQFREGLAAVWTVTADGGADAIRYIRPDGSDAFALADATWTGSFAGGRAPAAKADKQGFIDKEGQWVIEPKYDWVWPFEEGRALVAMIGEKSRPANERETQQAAASQGVRSDVWLKGVYGFVDSSGAEVVAPQYDSAWPFREERAWVEKGGTIGYIDPSGALVIPMEFEKAGFFVDGHAPVMKGGKWGLIARDGTPLTGFEFDALYEPGESDVLMGQFLEGKQPVRLGGAWGYLGEDGQMAIAARYAEARHFSGGLAAAREVKAGDAGLWGFLNAAGEWAVAPQFDRADDFTEGLARIYKGNQMGYINTNGEFVWPLTN